jgi:SAM-dependent methyltransferase
MLKAHLRFHEMIMSVPDDFKQQEVKFVEWSKAVTARNFDIGEMVARLRAMEKRPLRVLDVGGGIGTVGILLAEATDDLSVDVVDNSILGRRNFVRHDKVQLVFGDFLSAEFTRKYDVIIFRTVLHHILGRSKTETVIRQRAAIDKASAVLADGGRVFVTENFYEPFIFSDITGEIIYQLTILKGLAPIFRRLGANTAGEGVRFRSFRGWMDLFATRKFKVTGEVKKQQWKMPIWQRVPFFCSHVYQGFVELEKARS